MSVWQLIYLSLLGVCFGLSIGCRKSDPALRIFPYLFAVSLITEVIVSLLYHRYRTNYNVVYHVYLPIEYTLLAIYFYRQATYRLHQQLIIASIPAYLLASFLLSSQTNSITEHPGLNFNLEGVLLITWSVTALFTAKAHPHYALVSLPLFWICLGLLTFHSGIFFFNFIYNHLNTVNVKMADELHQLVIKNVNYLLYIFFSVAFLCSERIMKST